MAKDYQAIYNANNAKYMEGLFGKPSVNPMDSSFFRASTNSPAEVQSGITKFSDWLHKPAVGVYQGTQPQSTMFQVNTPNDAVPALPELPPLELTATYAQPTGSVNPNRGIPQGAYSMFGDTGTVGSLPVANTPTAQGNAQAQAYWGAVGGQTLPSQFTTRDQLIQWQQANGLTADGLFGKNSAAKYAELNPAAPSTGTSMFDGYTQAGRELAYAGLQSLDGTQTGGGSAPTPETAGLMESLRNATGMTNTDLLGAGASIVQGGIGAYGMFKNLNQLDRRLDQSQQQIDMAREEYDENLRHRRAVVEQNKGA